MNHLKVLNSELDYLKTGISQIDIYGTGNQGTWEHLLDLTMAVYKDLATKIFFTLLVTFSFLIERG